MFRSFFLSRRWLPWSMLGTRADPVRHLVSSPAGRADQRVVRHVLRPHPACAGQAGIASRMAEYWAQIATFFRIAMLYVTIAVVLDFFVKHYIFRWRTAMNDYYMEHWHKLRHIEGRRNGCRKTRCASPASWKAWAWTSCAALMALVRSCRYWGAVGEGDRAAVYRRGTAFTGLGGDRLCAGRHGPAGCRRHQAARAGVPEPTGRGGIPQGTGVRRGRREPRVAAGGRHTVRARADATISACSSTTCTSTWRSGRTCSSACWCPTSRWRPTLVAGVVTLGVMQQIVRAFGRVESSFQFLVLSWSTIVELMSVYKRLRAFEAQIHEGEPAPLVAEGA